MTENTTTVASSMYVVAVGTTDVLVEVIDGTRALVMDYDAPWGTAPVPVDARLQSMADVESVARAFAA